MINSKMVKELLVNLDKANNILEKYNYLLRYSQNCFSVGNDYLKAEIIVLDNKKHVDYGFIHIIIEDGLIKFMVSYIPWKVEKLNTNNFYSFKNKIDSLFHDITTLNNLCLIQNEDLKSLNPADYN